MLRIEAMNKRSPIGVSSIFRGGASKKPRFAPNLKPTLPSTNTTTVIPSKEEPPKALEANETNARPQRTRKNDRPVVLVPVEEGAVAPSASAPFPTSVPGPAPGPAPAPVPVPIPIPIPVRTPAPKPIPIAVPAYAPPASMFMNTDSALIEAAGVDTGKIGESSGNMQSESSRSLRHSSSNRSKLTARAETSMASVCLISNIGVSTSVRLEKPASATTNIDIIDVDVPKFTFKNDKKTTNSSSTSSWNSSRYNMRSRGGNRTISASEGCYSSSSISSSSSGIRRFRHDDSHAGVTVNGMKVIKRDHLFPSCFGVTSDQLQCTFTVYLRKSREGVGLKLKNVEDKVVIRGFADNYSTLQADANYDLQVNDVVVSVDHWDTEASGFDKVINELRWTAKDQRRLDEIIKERKRFRDDTYTGPLSGDSSSFLGVKGINNSDLGEVFTCLQIARVLVDMNSDVEDDDDSDE